MLCALKKDLIAFTAMHGYKISEKQFASFHPVLVVHIENVHVIVNVIVRCFDVSQLVQSCIYKIRFPVAQGYSGKHPWTLYLNCCRCYIIYHFDHLLE